MHLRYTINMKGRENNIRKGSDNMSNLPRVPRQRSQHPRAIKMLVDHVNEKPTATLLNENAVVWQWSDKCAVLKSFSAAIAYYDPVCNEVFTVRRYNSQDSKHIKQFKAMVVRH